MKILILGGAGFIGNNLARYCLNQPNAKVTILDSLDPYSHSTCDQLKEIWHKIEFVRGSVLDEALLSKVVQDKDLIFNLAGQTSHKLSLENPLLDAEVNCIGHLKVLEAIRLFNPEARIVYASSSTAVGKAEEAIVDESHPEKPLEIYSANKGAAEKYYRIYHKIHGLKTVVLRFSNLYGPYGKDDPSFGFVNYFIFQSLKNKVLSVYGDGEQTRNLMFVDDAVGILWKAANAEELFGQVSFATSSYHHSVKDVADLICEVFEGGFVEYVEWPERAREMDVERVMFSSEKLRAATGWQAQYSLREGLEKTKEVMLRNKYAWQL